jgi:hypothetical protein
MPGPEPEFIKWLITLGVGGVLAGFMFVFYRKDIKQYTELWKITTDQMTTVVKENTASNVRLIAMLETGERNALRKADIEELVDRRVKKSEGSP